MTAPVTATLTDFLLARIAEDEAVGQAAPTDGALIWSDNGWVPPPWAKVRVLVESEAKRRIVEVLRDLSGEDADDQAWALEYGDNAQRVAIATLRLLALPYADHPDYREDWRP